MQYLTMPGVIAAEADPHLATISLFLQGPWDQIEAIILIMRYL